MAFINLFRVSGKNIGKVIMDFQPELVLVLNF